MEDDHEHGRTWEQLEHIFQDYRSRCIGYWWIHNHIRARNDVLRLGLSIPSMVLSTLGGITLFASISNDDGCEPLSITATVGAIEILSIVLNAVVTAYRFGEKVGHHKATAEQYHQLANTIDRELRLPVFRREDPISLYTAVSSQYDELQKSSSTEIHATDIVAFENHVAANRDLSIDLFFHTADPSHPSAPATTE